MKTPFDNYPPERRKELQSIAALWDDYKYTPEDLKLNKKQKEK